MAAKKVVVDTNVIISGIFSTKDTAPRRIIIASLMGKIKFVFSEALKTEIKDVLKRPFFKDKSKECRIILGTLFNQSEIVKPKKINTIFFNDENDHFLLELAVTAKVHYIITGDKLMSKSSRVCGVEILSPSNFCKKIKL